MASELKQTLTKRYGPLQLWEIIVIALFAAFTIFLGISIWLSFRKKSKRSNTTSLPVTQSPHFPEEIKEISVDHVSSNNNGISHLDEKFNEDIEKGNNYSGSSEKKTVVGSHLVPATPTSTTVPSPLRIFPRFLTLVGVIGSLSVIFSLQLTISPRRISSVMADMVLYTMGR